MHDDNPPEPPPTQWQFKPNETSTPVESDDNSALDNQPMTLTHAGDNARSSAAKNNSVSWTASEFIAYHKSVGWYALLVLATVILSLLTFWLTKDSISAGMIVIVAIIFGVYAARKPRTLTFMIDSAGLTIAQKFYPFSQFRSFALMNEEALASVVFMPLKRFMPLITVYYDPKDGPKIVDVLAARLPMETHKLDLIDQLMQRIRF